MRRLAIVAVTASCAPRWLHPEHRSTALDQAIERAGANYSCPRERVELRCDATARVYAGNDTMVAYSRDSVIGQVVDSARIWTFDLDVCGTAKRYTLDMLRASEPGWREYGDAMVEQASICGAGEICVDTQADCNSVARGSVWAREVAPGPDHGKINDALAVQVRDNGARVTVAVERPEWLAQSCGDDSVALVIDGRWFALCGAVPKRDHDLATGITLGPGTHELVLHRGAMRSATVTAIVKQPLSWKDIRLVID